MPVDGECLAQHSLDHASGVADPRGSYNGTKPIGHGGWVQAHTLEDELTFAERAELAAIGSPLELPRRNPIVRMGDNADAVYTVVSGVVRIYLVLGDGRRQIIGFLQPGDVFGFAYADTHAYGADTVTPVQLKRYPRPAFTTLCERIPNLERALLRAAVHELTLAQDHMVMLGRPSARGRVASFLLRLAARGRHVGGTSAGVWVPMSQADIADYLGLSSESVSRAVTWFKRRGAIQSLSRDIIQVLDRTVLEDCEGQA
jgi:CRP/FNR family transcriptional regulator